MCNKNEQANFLSQIILKTKAEEKQFLIFLIFPCHLSDLHDYVMRFNHAPTQGYEVDVGRKTTIRVVNSQVSIDQTFRQCLIHSPVVNENNYSVECLSSKKKTTGIGF